MSPLDLELQLRQHGSALRALAQDLVRDGNVADDLVQQTMQSALDRPPAQPGPLGGWLATVLRRLHLQRRRRLLRAGERERAAARPELVASTFDQVERRDTLRTVTTAVFALEEPYQTTLLLRYFEDLTPAAIALRTSTSVATVKSRLQRGLQLLRGRLDRSLGDRDRWTRALCAATGLKLLTTTTILTTGALLMGPTTKLALGGAAALLLGALWWTLLGTETAPAQPDAAKPEIATAATAAATEVARPTAPDRVALPGATRDDSALLHPFAYELEVQVLDRLGLPVEGAKVLLAPAGCRLDEVPERTDSAGMLRIQWRGRSASMPLVVATTRDETRESIRQVTVQSGAAARVVFGGSSQQRTTIRLVGSGGNGQTFNLSVKDFQGRSTQDLVLAIDGIVTEQGPFADNPQMRDGLHPFASFGDVQWQKHAEEGPDLVLGGSVLSFSFGSGETSIVGKLVRPEDANAPLPARIEGTVYGEDGKPCARCPVAYGKQVDRPSERTETDDHGAFHFDNVPEGAFELRAGGSDAGLQHLTISTMRGQTTTTDVQLRRESTVRGHAVSTDGKPLAGWRVEWVGTQTPWFDACTVADNGSFVLPNLPGGAGQLLLWRGKGPARLPVLQLANVLPDNGDVDLRFDAEICNGKLMLEPMLPDGVDKAAVEARVFHEDSGRGATLQKEKDTNQFSLRGLAAGWYRLELGGPGLGWLDAGRHFLDGKSLVDLGRVAMPGAGTLRLQLPDGMKLQPADDKGSAALEIYRRRPDCDVRIEDTAAGTGDALPLPPGDYFAMWRSATGAPGFTPFTVQTGREVAVKCMDRDVQAWPADAAGAARERR